MTGGNLAAFAGAVAGYRAGGVIRTADRHACLAGRPEPVVLPEDHPLLTAIRRLGARAWSIAKTAAALAPLDAALPGLVASLSGLSVSEVDQMLALSCHAGAPDVSRPSSRS